MTLHSQSLFEFVLIRVPSWLIHSFCPSLPFRPSCRFRPCTPVLFSPSSALVGRLSSVIHILSPVFCLPPVPPLPCPPFRLFPCLLCFSTLCSFAPLCLCGYNSIMQNKPNSSKAENKRNPCAHKELQAKTTPAPAKKTNPIKPNSSRRSLWRSRIKPNSSRPSRLGRGEAGFPADKTTSHIRPTTYACPVGEIRHTQYRIPDGFLPNPWPILSWPPGKCFSYNGKNCKMRSNGQAGSAPTWPISWRLRRQDRPFDLSKRLWP